MVQYTNFRICKVGWKKEKGKRKKEKGKRKREEGKRKKEE
jgi:hypothetical protein